MSKYNDYGQFMVAVLDEADAKCHDNSYGSLINLFRLSGVNENLMYIIKSIFEVGWPAFVAICALLVLGPIAFATALVAFVAGGIGAIVIAGLAVYGGVKAIKLLYSNRTTPLTIYEVGKKYKSRFDAHVNDYSYIDNLIDEASDEIIQNA